LLSQPDPERKKKEERGKTGGRRHVEIESFLRGNELRTGGNVPWTAMQEVAWTWVTRYI